MSPWLDDLLDLSLPAQAARLAALRAEDARLADSLQILLGRLRGMGEAGFLETPPLPAIAALATPAAAAGQTVGAYTLLHELGLGGMGSVWLARRADGRYDGQVAIKFMRSGLMGQGDAQRFLREGQLLARLDHPHIARLLDAGLTQPAGQPYLVLEHVAGLPITQHCDAQQLDTSARVRLMLQVLAAVAHAHSRLILHRDLKPANILVTADGQPKLLDFGIGKLMADAAGASEAGAQAATAPSAQADQTGRETGLTQRLGVAYTARYAAPEQLQAQEVTTATDVYALGVLLYGLLGGGHPTEQDGAAPLDRLRAAVEVVPPRLSDAVLRRGGADAERRARRLRGDLDTIVARALKKQPAERYANAAALADDLRRWLDHEPIRARPDRAGYRLGRFIQRHLRVVVAAGTAGALALTAGSGLALWQAQVARAERAQAQEERAQAEVLVEFMLGDLKDKLNQLGRADLLQAVGDRALAYYRDAPVQTLADPDLARRARAQALIAEGARQRMDVAQAQRGFEQAAATTAALLAHAPDDLQRLQDHLASLHKLEEMAITRGDNAGALARSQQASVLLRQAARRSPGRADLQLQAISADQGVAYNLARAGRPAQALPLLAQARDEARTLPADLPNLRREQADNQLTEGLALVALGRYGDAAQAFQACIAMMAGAPALEDDVWQRRVRAVAQRSLARVHLNQGQLAQAERLAASVVRDTLADTPIGPENRMLAQQLNDSRLVLAEAQWLQGHTEAARHQLALLQAHLAQARDVDTGHAEWHLRTRGSMLALAARMQDATPAPGSAPLVALQALVDLAQALEAQGRALQNLPLLAVLQAQMALGDALARAGQDEDAARHWQAVASRALPAAEQGFPPAMQQLALARTRLGQWQQARSWLDRLRATDYRHPDLATLTQALAQAPVATEPPVRVGQAGP